MKFDPGVLRLNITYVTYILKQISSLPWTYQTQ